MYLSQHSQALNETMATMMQDSYRLESGLTYEREVVTTVKSSNYKVEHALQYVGQLQTLSLN